MLPALKKQYPDIHGLIWFVINKETDWRKVRLRPHSKR